MTLPPDERDPTAGGPPSAPEPVPAEAPTQAWAPAPPSEPAPAPLVPDPPPQPATNPIISADPASAPAAGGVAPGAAVAWATPKQVQDVGAPGLTWADTPSRLVAYILNSFVVAFVAGIVVTVLQIGGPAGTTNTQSSQAISVLTTLLGAAYFIASWSGGRRATPAQRLFNIQVGNAFDGHALTSTQAAKRWLGTGSFLALFGLLPASSIFGLLNLLQLVWVVVLLVSTVMSPTKQGLHDRFANSAVVRPIGASSGLAVACLVLVIGLLLLAILSIVALIFLGGQVSTILSEVGTSV